MVVSQFKEKPQTVDSFTTSKNLIGIEIECQGKKVNAVIDTGSTRNIVSRDFAHSLSLPRVEGENVFLKLANDSLVRSAGGTEIALKINDETITVPAVVVDKSPYDILLGIQFCEKTGTVIDFKSKNIKVCGTNFYLPPKFSSIPVKSIEELKVPANSEVCLFVEVISSASNVLIEPDKDSSLRFGLLTCKTLTDVSNNNAYLRVANMTDSDVLIPHGAKLAKASEIEEVFLLDEEKSSEEINGSKVNLGEYLDQKEKNEVIKLLNKFSSVISKGPLDLGKTNLTKHKIDTGNIPPIHSNPYRRSFKEREIINQEVEKLEEGGIIRHSDSPWGSPVVLVKKPDGSYRFCVDWRKINKVTRKDVHPIPRIDDTLDRLSGSKYFSSLDLASGFWQVELEEESKEKTAFVTQDGHYEFNVLGMGLCNSPATFQRLMNKTLGGLMWKICMAYMDDIIVFSKTFESHLNHLQSVLECLQKANLKIKLQKCYFAQKKLKYLGHIVDKNGISPDPKLIEAIEKFPVPNSVKNIQSFLGITGYYRKFIKDYSKKAKPLTELIKKDKEFFWSFEAQQSFEMLKKCLINPPILAHPRFDLPFEIFTDASAYGIGAILKQRIDGKEQVIAYASKTLNKAEIGYSATDRECLAIVFGCKKFRPYIYGTRFKIVTDHHALCWLMSVKNPHGRLSRWSVTMQDYDIEIVHKSGRKHMDADALSRSPIELSPQKNAEEIVCCVDTTDVRQEQMKEPFCARLINYLEGKVENPNRKIIRTSKPFTLQENKLFRKRMTSDGIKYVLVIPKTMREEILFNFHDHVLSGHLGFKKTWEKVKNRFFWPKMLATVKNYVFSCEKCNLQKPSNQKPVGLLQSIPPTERPFEKIGIDKMGPFPTSINGNKHIMVCTDYCTKYVIAAPVKNGTAEETAKFLMDKVFLNFGTPKEIITDRGKEFNNSLIDEVLKLFSIEHKKTSAFHPRTNGQTERFNKTLATMISHYVNGSHTDWDKYIGYLIFAFNTSVHETTGYTPFYLTHSYEADLPIDRSLGITNNPLGGNFSIEKVISARKRAKETIETNQEKSKILYDQKRRQDNFKKGELVYVKYPNRKHGKSEKLLNQYRGPLEIVRQTAPNNYEIKNSAGKCDIVAVERIKHYQRRVPQIKTVNFAPQVIVIHPNKKDAQKVPLKSTDSNPSPLLQKLEEME